MPGSGEEQKVLHVGIVKWFNNKSGYGFITVLSDGDFNGKDIFAHHSSINVKSDLYKYLVQGEYVEFNIEKINSQDKEKYENQATHITGIKRGDLMCETRNNNKDSARPRGNGLHKKSIK